MTGFPVGLPYDANINAGIPPIETRARYDENLSFVLKAWTAREPFAWNGKYSQYMSVNVWPRPFQTPHPPVSVTGTGNPNTTRFALQRDFGFNLIVMGGPASAAQRIFDGLWRTADELGVDDNPFRANFAQFVLVADTDREAERLYAEHVAYSVTRGVGHIPMHRYTLPGGISPPGLRVLLANSQLADAHPSEPPSFGQLVESGAIVAGSVATVRDQLADRARSYRVGNLLVMLQMGSMPTDLVKHNIDLFAGQVMPGLKDIWSEYEEANRWWPARLGGRPVSVTQTELAGVHADMTTFATRTETVEAWGGRFDLRFQVAGSGPALVYLHGARGMYWDELLRGLSDRFTVYAPMFPGTDPSGHDVDPSGR